MATRTRPIKIIARDQDFPCPIGWNVEKAEERIRKGFGLTDGWIQCNGEPMSDEDKIGDPEGDLTFVGGRDLPTQPAEQPVGKP
jgi:hypothetical protein